MIKNIEPLRSAFFGLSAHQYQQFNATVPGILRPADLESPALWVNVASKLQVHDEIRAIADDSSFYAQLLVTFVNGTDVRVKVVFGVEFEGMQEEVEDNAPYFCKQRGPLKWCIVKRSTGENVKKMMPTRLFAEKELSDYVRAMNS